MPANPSRDLPDKCSTSALEQAGIDRNKAYLTNAVKHFKFLARGKFRLHQKPTTPQIKACRPWYERELAAIKPDLVMAMGATRPKACSARSLRSTTTAAA